MNDSALRVVDLRLTAKIVGSYVKHHGLTSAALPQLIAAVHGWLSALGGSVVLVAVPTPAVPVRQSVQRDFVTCLECGFRGKTIRRHLRMKHGLERDAYRKRWNLSSTHPIVAPAYAESRSALARDIGLGRGGARHQSATALAEATDPAFVASLSVRKRRGRRPSPT